MLNFCFYGKKKKWEWTILPLMESDDFPSFLVSCPWKFPRISPGQVQNYQLFFFLGGGGGGGGCWSQSKALKK